MPKVSKKKRFRGTNRWDVPDKAADSEQGSSNVSATEDSFSTPVRETASARKVGDQAEERSTVSDSAYSYRLVEMSGLLKAFKSLHECKAGGTLELKEDEALTYGNSSLIHIECSKCDVKLELQTSGNTGYSQNANESINSLVWNRAPKHRNKGPKAIEMAAMPATMQFNSGANSRHEVMKAANIPAGVFTGEGSAKKDKTRISKSVNKAKMKSQ